MLIAVDKIKDEEIEEQIEIREKLLTEMVGELYPSIIRAEISKLRQRLYKNL